MFSAWKLCQSSSISGPSTTRKPSRVKTSTISRSTSVSGWSDPVRGAGPGSVRSMRSASRSARSAAPRRARAACLETAVRAARTSFASADGSRRSSSSEPRAPLQLTEAGLAAQHRDLRRLELLQRRRGLEGARAPARARSRGGASISAGVHGPPSLATGLRPASAVDASGGVEVQDQPPVLDARPTRAALRLRHAAHHEQADLRPRAGAGPARLEQRLGVRSALESAPSRRRVTTQPSPSRSAVDRDRPVASPTNRDSSNDEHRASSPGSGRGRRRRDRPPR